MKKYIARFAWKYGIPEKRKYVSSKYSHDEFKREAVRGWKTKYKDHRKEKKSNFFSMKKVARMPLVLDEMLTEIKSILSKLRLSEAATTRKVIITVGNSVLSALCPEKMAKNGGSITLSNKWPQNVLKSLDWLKQRGATTKREMNPALYELFFRGKEN